MTSELRQAQTREYMRKQRADARAMRTGSPEPRKPLTTPEAIRSQAASRKWRQAHLEEARARDQERRVKARAAKKQRMLEAIAQADATRRNHE